MVDFNLSEWVKKSRTKAGLTQEMLAEKLNMTKANISAMENGRIVPSFINILEIATLANVNLPHQQDDEKPKLAKNHLDTVIIPEYDALAECGSGFDFNEDIVDIIGGMPFSKSQLVSLGVNEKHACIIQAIGDSMSPTIVDGATVMIDLSQKEPIEGAVFAIMRSGNGTVIKRLRRNAEKRWLYSSDNIDKNRYQDMYAYEDDRIIGRVVWQASFSGL